MDQRSTDPPPWGPQRCSDGFMLVLAEIIPQFDLFSCNCPCRSAENKAKQVIEQEYLIFTQGLDEDMSN